VKLWRRGWGDGGDAIVVVLVQGVFSVAANLLSTTSSFVVVTVVVRGPAVFFSLPSLI
jgi:hypothetical protein